MENRTETQCRDGSELHDWSSLAASRKTPNKRICNRCGKVAQYSDGGWDIVPHKRR